MKAKPADHSDAIGVFYLPNYSPELNPDEMTEADIKQPITKLAPARTTRQLAKVPTGQQRMSRLST